MIALSWKTNLNILVHTRTIVTTWIEKNYFLGEETF